MKYIRLYEERLKDFEIMVGDSKSLIEELKTEIEKEEYDLDYIKDLLYWGHFDIDVIWKDILNREWTFLQKASQLNKADIARVLLEEGADPNIQDNYGLTALHLASVEGYAQVVQELLSYPIINVNIKNNLGNTALHVASLQGHSHVVQALLNHPDIDKTIADDDGYTAWDLAKTYIHDEFPELNPDAE